MSRPKCYIHTYIHTCTHLYLNFYRESLVMIEWSNADRLTSGCCILAVKLICTSQPNGLEYYKSVTVKYPDDIFFWKGWNLIFAGARVEKRPRGGTDQTIKCELSFWLNCFTDPKMCPCNHTATHIQEQCAPSALCPVKIVRDISNEGRVHLQSMKAGHTLESFAS